LAIKCTGNGVWLEYKITFTQNAVTQMHAKPYFVITYQGKYNPYVIADVTSIVTDSRLNIVAVEQNSLYGLSILMLIAETLDDQGGSAAMMLTNLQNALKKLSYDVHVELATPAIAKRAVGKKLQVFTIIGRDKVGILKAITSALANFRVSIDRMRHLARGDLVVIELHVDASELRDLSVLKEVIQNTCDKVGFDTIIQPESSFRQRRRLVVFDMDNTIIQGEVIDELAKAANVGGEVSSITEQAMAGKLDFEESLRRRVAYLTGLSAHVLEEIADSMVLTPGASDVTKTLKAMGFKTALISGGFYFFANRVKEKLGFDYVYANELEVKDGFVTGKLKGPIIDKEAKGRILDEIARAEGISKKQVVAVGDGANDEVMLKNAGFGIAFKAHEILQKVADGRLTANNLLGLLYCLGATEEVIDEFADKE